MHRLQELVRLYRSGHSPKEVKRLLRMGNDQELKYRRALQEAGLLAGDPEQLPDLELVKEAVGRYAPPKTPPQQMSSVQQWGQDIERLFHRGAKPRAIHDWLRQNRTDFPGGKYAAVKRYCRRLRKARGIRPEDVDIPVETLAGEVAQVDFGYAGKTFDPLTGKHRRTWVFVMVLGYSRHMFADFVYDQRQETWVMLHMRAFAHFGGVPEVIVPDNLKSAVIRAAFATDDDESALNRTYREIARHYGFKVDPTPPYQPNKKGKVEAAVKYVKNNFCKTHLPAPIGEARTQLECWVRDIAGMRDHGTTGKKPLEVFEAEERHALGPLPGRLYEPVIWHQAKVHPDCHVSFRERTYSVPWKLVGQQTWIRATPTTVAILHDDVRVATHQRRGLGRCTNDAHLPEHRSDYRYRQSSYWIDRAGRMGDEVAHYIKAVFASDDVLHKIRTVQAIVKHLEDFPPERARSASCRAQHFGCYSCRGLKNILRQGLDLVPLEDEPLQWQATIPRPTFARTPTYYLNPNLEVTDERS